MQRFNVAGIGGKGIGLSFSRGFYWIFIDRNEYRSTSKVLDLFVSFGTTMLWSSVTTRDYRTTEGEAT
jgi:hypothetical protein